MSVYTETRVISLNSENANQYRNGTYLSNLVFGMNGLLVDDPNIIHKQISLINAQMPVSFYIVNYTNNILIFYTGVTNYTITIPVGNYNSTNFISTLTATILAVTGVTVTITLDTITGKMTFSSVTNYQIKSTMTEMTSNLIIGTSSTSNLVPSLISGNYVAECPFALNLLGIKQLQVKSSYITMNNFSSNAGGQDCLLGTIPVDVGAWGMINYINTGNDITFLNATLDDVDINIVDAETGKYINFGNCGWTMTILIHITRKTEFDTIPKYIKQMTPALATFNQIPEPEVAQKVESIDPDLKLLQS